MSKTKSTGKPVTKEEIQEKKQRILDHLKAMCETNKRAVRLFGILFLVGYIVASLFVHIAAEVHFAMLYLIADNGTKSGRASGNVYMRNGRVRKFTMPSLVQNGYTAPVRAAFGNFSASFRALTQSQIAAWNGSTGFSKTNRVGVSFPLKGKALYQALNQNLFNVGEAPISDPPTSDAVPGITDVTLTMAALVPTFSIAFSPSPTDANVSHLVEATAQLSPGVSRPGRSQFRVIAIIRGGDATPQSKLAGYNTKFGTLVEGNKVFIRLTPINVITGQAGASIVTGSIVAT